MLEVKFSDGLFVPHTVHPPTKLRNVVLFTHLYSSFAIIFSFFNTVKIFHKYKKSIKAGKTINN